jgi:hypothetical protein
MYREKVCNIALLKNSTQSPYTAAQRGRKQIQIRPFTKREILSLFLFPRPFDCCHILGSQSVDGMRQHEEKITNELSKNFSNFSFCA